MSVPRAKVVTNSTNTTNRKETSTTMSILSTLRTNPVVTLADGTEHTLSPKALEWLEAVNAPGINVVNVAWQSAVKPAAAHKAHTLSKTTTATVMTGVEYANLAVNNDRETGSLPWGQWAVYPWIIVHKGAEYVRMNTVDGSLRTTRFIDGGVARKDDFDAMLTASAREAARPHGGTITVKLSGVAAL